APVTASPQPAGRKSAGDIGASCAGRATCPVILTATHHQTRGRANSAPITRPNGHAGVGSRTRPRAESGSGEGANAPTDSQPKSGQHSAEGTTGSGRSGPRRTAGRCTGEGGMTLISLPTPYGIGE